MPAWSCSHVSTQLAQVRGNCAKSIDSLMAAFAAKARPELQSELNALRHELAQGKLLGALGIRVTAP